MRSRDQIKSNGLAFAELAHPPEIDLLRICVLQVSFSLCPSTPLWSGGLTMCECDKQSTRHREERAGALRGVPSQDAWRFIISLGRRH